MQQKSIIDKLSIIIRWLNEWMNERINKGTDEWTTNDLSNQQIKVCVIVTFMNYQ